VLFRSVRDLPTVIDGKTVFEADYLIGHGKDYHELNVIVGGYIVSGFNGFHTNCYVSQTKDGTNDLGSIWVNDKNCYTHDKSKYREGYGIVRGTYIYEDNPFFLSGAIYQSQIKFGVIEWVD